MECVDRKMFSESMNEDANDGINRLEQQFSMLKVNIFFFLYDLSF